MAQTVATDLLNNMTSGQIFAEDYNNQLLYVHAVKVFLMSYPEHFNANLDDNQLLFGAKVRQLMRLLDDLYQQQMSATPGPVLNFVWKQCQSLTYFLIFAVKRFIGRTLSENLSFSVTNTNTSDQIGPMALDHSCEVQSNKFLFKDYAFINMIVARRENHVFHMTVNATQWEQNTGSEALKSFSIGISHVHPEGYQRWVDFGKGTRLLVEVSFRVRPIEDKDMSDFHLQSIYKMIRRRLTVGGPVQWHKHMTNLNRSTCTRDDVQPNTDQMYWRVSEDRSMAAFREWAESGGTMPKPLPRAVAAHRVPHFDLQKSVTFGEDIEETVCLCNEWCNWNAFFHHNPIYRFIIVQNSNLFIENYLNNADIYLFAAVKNASEPQILPRTGYIIQLIHSANYYSNIFYRTYMMASQDLMNSYVGAHPHPLYLTGVVYNNLKTDIDTVTLCQQLDTNPMADICIKNLLDYYKVYKGMHDFIGQWPVFVDPANQIAWTQEYENNTRVDVKTFVQTCIKHVFEHLVLPNPTDDDNGEDLKISVRDRVFGSDTEYTTYLPKSAEEVEVKLARNRALQRGRNPLNVDVQLDPYIHAFICVYKLFPKLEATLPAIHSERAAQHTSDYYIRFDRAFSQHHNQNPSEKFTVSQQELNSGGLPPDLRPNIAVFYTLKLYSFGWTLQKHCITARADLLSYTGRTSLTQIADSFRFVFNNEIIEETVRNAHDLSLFELDEALDNHFDVFYDFWGDVPHEQKNLQQYEQNFESALGQYRRLYVWYTNDGHNRHNFQTIINQFGQSLITISDRSGTIFEENIAPTLHWLVEVRQYLYGIDVMDVLVVYLVRATCYCIAKAVADLFRLLHGLQVERLCRQNWSFSLGKAGLRELLMTITALTEPLADIRANFIVFDDEIDRIDNTLRQTTRLCRQFYKFLYMKLSSEWLREFGQIYQDTFQKPLTAGQEKTCGDLMVLQFVVGLSFVSAFVNHFRYEFWGLRRALRPTFQSCIGNASHLQRFHSSLPLGLDYLSDPTAVQSSHPFATDIWNNYLNQTIPELQTLRPEDVGLDMNAAQQ